MSSAEVYDSLIVEVSEMGRAAILERLGSLSPELPLDFSAGFLAGCDDEKLRHVLLAALWRTRMKRQARGA